MRTFSMSIFISFNTDQYWIDGLMEGHCFLSCLSTQFVAEPKLSDASRNVEFGKME